MLINIGQEKMITDSEIIGIFDLDNTTVSKATRDYINFSVKENECVTVLMEDLPKSFIVCEKEDRRTVYISPYNTATVYKRLESKKIY